jgi:ribosomal protein S18 acetylase RimI-like enzyme
MKYELASKFSEEELVQAHNEVFIDYDGVGELSLEVFQAINVQRGVKYEFSIVALENDKIVGIILNAIRKYKGVKTGYDCGTGVIPEMRSKGIAKAMFDEVKKILLSIDCHKYVLEVIQTNDKAFNLYKNQGFEIIREFDCLGGKREDFENILPQINVEDAQFSVHSPSDYPWDIIVQFQRYPPSWQNSNASMKNSPRHKILQLNNANFLEGYMVFNPRSGEITQIGAIKLAESGKKMINYLLMQNEQIQQVFQLNVDTRDSNLLDLYQELQFQSFTKQYEMVLKF